VNGAFPLSLSMSSASGVIFASPSAFISISSPLFLPRDHHRRSPILAQAEMRPTCQTVAIVGHAAEDTQADAAHEADVDDVPVAETSGTKVDGDAGREDEVGA
jgi:hypothetical protein